MIPSSVTIPEKRCRSKDPIGSKRELYCGKLILRSSSNGNEFPISKR
jgi:hypothetical protein